jgi:hypothetical protein
LSKYEINTESVLTVLISRGSDDVIAEEDCFIVTFPQPYEDSKEEFESADPDFEFYESFPADLAYGVTVGTDSITAEVERIDEEKLRVRIADATFPLLNTATFEVSSFVTPYS